MENMEHPGIKKALRKFFDDFEAVFDTRPLVNEASKATLTGGYSLYLKNNSFPDLVVIVGSVERCTMFETLESVNIFDSSLLRGQHECYRIIPVENLSFAAYPGIKRLLIVAGSDLTGTIYALGKLSELFGISPWSCFTGLQPVRRRSFYLSREDFPMTSSEPSVHFRGFCVDSVGSPSKLNFYKKMFELLLRLKGNYMWPLANFSPENDPEDAEVASLASELGITLGNPFINPDLAMSDGSQKAPGTEKSGIFKLIGGFRSRRRHTTDILMLSDDNYGHIGLLPGSDLANGDKTFGMYYHLAYNGRPESYGWPNCTHPSKIWTQMTAAFDYGVRGIWVVNAGTIKGLELPLSYFMDLAYNYDRFGSSNPGNVENYTRDWVASTFPLFSLQRGKKGVPCKDLAATVLLDCACLNGRCRPSPEAPNRFPVVPDPKKPELPVIGSILEFADDLEERVKALNLLTAPGEEATFFELVTFPVLFSVSVHKAKGYSALSHYYADKNPAVSARFTELSYDVTRELYYLFDVATKNHYGTFFEENFLKKKIESVMAGSDHPPVQPLMGRIPRRTEKALKTPADYYYPTNKDLPEGVTMIFPDDFIHNEAAGDTEWLVLSPYGYNVSALCISPFYAHFEIPGTGPAATYEIEVPEDGFYDIRFQFAPTNNITATAGLRFAFSVNNSDSITVDTLPKDYRAGDPDSEGWADGVIDNYRCKTVFVDLVKGRNLLTIYAMDCGLIIEGIYVIEKKRSNVGDTV